MIIPKITFQLKLPEYWKIHLVFHISKLKKHIEPDEIFESREELQFLPEIVGDDQHEEYEVEWIINKQLHYRKLQYLVKWKGYPDYENTWELLLNLFNASDIIQEYEMSLNNIN